MYLWIKIVLLSVIQCVLNCEKINTFTMKKPL